LGADSGADLGLICPDFGADWVLIKNADSVLILVLMHF
jgi:hypothetical protein